MQVCRCAAGVTVTKFFDVYERGSSRGPAPTGFQQPAGFGNCAVCGDVMAIIEPAQGRAREHTRYAREGHVMQTAQLGPHQLAVPGRHEAEALTDCCPRCQGAHPA